MAATLATLNGEALAVPGLEFWGKRIRWGNQHRIALICSDNRGAIELWTCEEWMHAPDPMLRDLGGIEIHSRAQMYDGQDPIPDCTILGGDGRCYTDGSSLAYSRLRPLIEAGASAAVLEELAGWHRARFGSAVPS